MKLWQASGFAFATLGGTILHFLYEWTGNSILVAPLSGVNESTWEHMKLLYFPLFLFALVQSRFLRDRKNFWCVKLLGTVLGLILIPVLFYTIHGIVGGDTGLGEHCHFLCVCGDRLFCGVSALCVRVAEKMSPKIRFWRAVSDWSAVRPLHLCHAPTSPLPGSHFRQLRVF